MLALTAGQLDAVHSFVPAAAARPPPHSPQLLRFVRRRRRLQRREVFSFLVSIPFRSLQKPRANLFQSTPALGNQATHPCPAVHARRCAGKTRVRGAAVRCRAHAPHARRSCGLPPVLARCAASRLLLPAVAILHSPDGFTGTYSLIDWEIPPPTGAARCVAAPATALIRRP